MKNIFSFLMSLMFGIHISAQPIVNEKQAFLYVYISELNKAYQNPYFISEVANKLRKEFPSKEDRLFIQKMQAADMPKNISIEAENDTVIIKIPEFKNVVISDFDDANSSFKINQKFFKWDATKSLENNTNKIAELLNDNPKRSLLFRLFFPEAHAIDPATVVFALFGLSVVLLYGWNTIKSAYDSGKMFYALKTIDSNCKNEKIPLDNRAQKVKDLLAEFEASNPKLPQIGDYTTCEAWVQNALVTHSRKAKKCVKKEATYSYYRDTVSSDTECVEWEDDGTRPLLLSKGMYKSVCQKLSDLKACAERTTAAAQKEQELTKNRKINQNESQLKIFDIDKLQNSSKSAR